MRHWCVIPRADGVTAMAQITEGGGSGDGKWKWSGEGLGANETIMTGQQQATHRLACVLFRVRYMGANRFQFDVRAFCLPAVLHMAPTLHRASCARYGTAILEAREATMAKCAGLAVQFGDTAPRRTK